MNKIVDELQHLIREDLNKIEVLNLKEVNTSKYNDLKERYMALDKELALLIDNNPGSTLPLKWKYAKISAELDFYLTFLNGTGEVYAHKTNKIKMALEKLLVRLDNSNYVEIEHELKDTLDYFEDVLDNAAHTVEINDLIEKIRYSIAKCKLENQIIAPLFIIEQYLVYIINDINTILANEKTSPLIKERLQKYAINPDGIQSDYQTVLILINLSSREEITPQELKYELEEREYYEEGELEQDYKYVGFKIYESTQASNLYNINSLERLPSIIKDFLTKLEDNLYFGLKNDIKYIMASGFTHWVDFFKGLIVESNNIFDDEIFARIKEYFLYNSELKHAFNCAVIAYLDEIKGRGTLALKNLKIYAIHNHIEYLIRYFINHDMFIDKDFINTVIKMNNQRLNAALDNSNIAILTYDYVGILRKNNLDYHMQLKKYFLLTGFTKEQQAEYLLATIKPGEMTLYKIELEFLEEYGNENYFITLLKKAQNVEEMLFIVDGIKNEQIKSKVENYIYEELDKIYNKISTKIEDYAHNPFDKLTNSGSDNRFTAYYNSKSLDGAKKSNDRVSIRKLILDYGKANLDWQSILVSVYYDTDDVLDEEEATIYCEYYENLLKQKEITLEEEMEKVFSSDKEAFRRLMLIVYLAYKGKYLGNLILNYHLTDAYHYQNLFLEAIKNSQDKLNRLSYYQKLMSQNNRFYEEFKNDSHPVSKLNLDLDLVLLSNQELAEIRKEIAESEEQKANLLDIKLRKYFWDLVKLLNQDLSEGSKTRIVMYIARSNYKEHINFIATNHGEYLELLIENISDMDIQAGLISIYNDNVAQGKH